jgi:transposase
VSETQSQIENSNLKLETRKSKLENPKKRRRSFKKRAEELKAALLRARTKGQFQRAQCLWLRVALRLDAREVATALGWSVYAVRNLQSRYIRDGMAVLEGPGRGGRRRGLLTWNQEKALLQRLRRMTFRGHTLEFQLIHEAVEEAVGRTVSPNMVRRLLERHHWSVHAIVVPTTDRPPGEKVPLRTMTDPRVRYTPPLGPSARL